MCIMKLLNVDFQFDRSEEYNLSPWSPVRYRYWAAAQIFVLQPPRHGSDTTVFLATENQIDEFRLISTQEMFN